MVFINVPEGGKCLMDWYAISVYLSFFWNDEDPKFSHDHTVSIWMCITCTCNDVLKTSVGYICWIADYVINLSWTRTCVFMYWRLATSRLNFTVFLFGHWIEWTFQAKVDTLLFILSRLQVQRLYVSFQQTIRLHICARPNITEILLHVT